VQFVGIQLGFPIFIYMYICIRKCLAGAMYYRFAIISMTLFRTSSSV
jgi:hypothetical protein